MTREQIIEIMARAMHQKEWEPSKKPSPFEDENENGYWTEAAKTTLTALEAAGLVVVPAEPTDRMVATGEGYSDMVLPDGFENTGDERRKEVAMIWAKMIRAAQGDR